MSVSRAEWVYVLLMLVGAWLLVYGLNQQPGYTDAFYHYNAAERLVTGQGLVEPYLWTYTAAPQELPAPSHLYWQPGTSFVAAAGMWLFGVSYDAAQVGFWLSLWGASLLAYVIGRHVGNGRTAWLAGVLTLIAGFFTDMWGQIDTFAPYALVGGLALWSIGRGMTAGKRHLWWWVLAGVMAACGHLLRNDGLLLLLVGWAVLFWPLDWLRGASSDEANHTLPALRERALYALVFSGVYLLLMAPWFARNIAVSGAALPAGGTASIWFTEYNDLFNYPPGSGVSPELYLARGWDVILQEKFNALFGSGGVLLNFIAIEGYIVLSPFILLAAWTRRDDVFLRGVWLFAIGIHLAMGLLFTHPGLRGGLFHAVAALVPWWAALGLIGLDEVVTWVAARRRTWNPGLARPVFLFATVLIISVMTLAISSMTLQQTPNMYQRLPGVIPSEARVIINDPSELYYYTDIAGVPVPNEPPEIIPQLVQDYGVSYLVLEDGSIPAPMQFETAPPFLQPVEFAVEGVRVYAIELD
jgi:hypothetical protein